MFKLFNCTERSSVIVTAAHSFDCNGVENGMRMIAAAYFLLYSIGPLHSIPSLLVVYVAAVLDVAVTVIDTNSVAVAVEVDVGANVAMAVLLLLLQFLLLSLLPLRLP